MYQYMDTNEDVLTSSNKEGIERVKESKGGEKQRTKYRVDQKKVCSQNTKIGHGGGFLKKNPLPTK